MNSKNIHMAMVAAQAEFPTVGFDKMNPAFRSKYTSLTAIVEAVRPILNRHGCYITHNSSLTDRGVWVQTRIVHGESDTAIVTETELPLEVATAQKLGGALTYGRRYTLSMALGVVTDDDDDGQTASDTRTPQRQPLPSEKPAPPSNGHKPVTSDRIEKFLDWAAKTHAESDGPATAKQYNFLAGVIDGFTEPGAHNQIFELMIHRPVTSENPIGYGLAKQLLDWLPATSGKGPDKIANPNHKPDVVEIVKSIWAELEVPG